MLVSGKRGENLLVTNLHSKHETDKLRIRTHLLRIAQGGLHRANQPAVGMLFKSTARPTVVKAQGVWMKFVRGKLAI